ncbi:hypothetical protein ACQV2E_23690 [Pantoea allii]|uniref:Uncharacterized protein n=1 Tax=Pantoea allii TaxID=574096 RepID=A0ABS6VJY2_9GAMM|nr:hypothetical protein [Pantoea allii]MBW1215861.1 hypothetical protein [Pantoea allii]MBW1254568.1 hypothetical protein [Pantoea allii]MBW1259395.1 hypothetical protein [Pantoea allii]MBW1263772.1 hypothetical protein [Pantoea allii]MBW1268559.1 hypothetical protein [Pantoea allii]
MKPFSLLVNHPLDETYLSPPGDTYTEGELPEEETEVRQALTAMYVLTNRLMNIGLCDRLFRTRKYSSASGSATEAQRQLMALVNSTPLHKAALRRIVSVMPEDNGGREALMDYLG